MNNITIVFPGVQALDKVTLKLDERKFLALPIENEAGRSILSRFIDEYIQ
tara:strand:+ start:386 stop:535 length:150 start_codon:yes stop_codon:yes gene_type:complete